MDETPLISVIVPIYNVAPYLRKCLDSLKGQTLIDIEVICIDDGSTDESGRIADEYATDPRFRIIHTENRGLSAARNRGIDEARADWLMFVDSDDWVEPGFCEIPYRVAVENGAELVIFQSHYATEKGKVIKKKHKDLPSGSVSHEIAIDIGGTPAWNKLYKKHLFDCITYPEGHVYEDIAVTHQLVYRASKLESVSDELYFYRYRKGSISRSTDNSADRLEMSKRRYAELVKLGYPKDKAQAHMIGQALRCCGRIESVDSSVFLESETILDALKKVPDELSHVEKMMIRVWRLNKGLFRTMYKKYLAIC